MTLQVNLFDKVVVTEHDYVTNTDIPLYLSKVTKITPKRIYITDDAYFDYDGRSLCRPSYGRRITNDPAMIAEMEDELAKLKQEREERDRREAEDRAKPSYRLTRVQQSEWEVLGDAYLLKVLEDLEREKSLNAKAE